jgi:hypothetical protein
MKPIDYFMAIVAGVCLGLAGRDFDGTTRGIAGRSSVRMMTDYGKLDHTAE